MPLQIDPQNTSPLANQELVEALQEAALVHLHREIEAHGSVRLTPNDFGGYERLLNAGDVRLELNYDAASGDVILSEASSSSRPIN